MDEAIFIREEEEYRTAMLEQLDTIERSITAVKQELANKDVEIAELKSEVARHHQDFVTIRTLLSIAEVDENLLWVAKKTLKGIRNIVG